MEWSDDGIILSIRKHGETSAIVTLLTPERGRHAGLVRGGAGKRTRGLLQVGNLVRAHWRARLREHLGALSCELLRPCAALLLDDPSRLAALSAACAVAEVSLPEREPHRAVYDGLLAFLKDLDGPSWPSLYVKWELGLLGELGFGLDFTSCAATGKIDDLAYVSPKSGRAVSKEAGLPYKDVMLSLPSFLLKPGTAGCQKEVAEAFALSGYFLEKNVFSHDKPGTPAARQRLSRILEKDTTD
jgi:DNA repair protein RecO (recombination protein O)